MQTERAVRALGAISHEHRLAVFRLLVAQGPAGLSAGAISEAVGLPPSSLTFHLKALQHAGLVTQRRVSRQLIYAADFSTMNDLVRYLTENCCGGRQICEPAKAGRAAAPRKRSA